MQVSGQKIVVLGTGGTIAGTSAQAGDNIGYTAAQVGVEQLLTAVPGLQALAGGALVAFKKSLKYGIAAILSSGKQIISWIHIIDLVRLFTFILQHESLQGSFNAVAPKPVSNKTFIITLAKILRGKFYIPIHIPSCILKLLLGEMSVEVLKSTTVSCKKIHQQNFIFEFPTIQAALHNLSN